MAALVRLASAEDLEQLGAVEAAAGERFRSFGMAEIADGGTAEVAELREAQAQGRLWVGVRSAESNGAESASAESEREQVGGFLMASVLGGCGHLDEVSVHPDFAGQRLGARLIDVFVDWGRSQMLPALTLTTFADVPWNRPYYETLGFLVLAQQRLSPALRGQMALEAELGLDPSLRVAMQMTL